MFHVNNLRKIPHSYSYAFQHCILKSFHI
jgi:hypothetical protein